MKESVQDLYGCSKKKESKPVKAEVLQNYKKATRKHFKKDSLKINEEKNPN
jgi:hypothetical protein